MSKAEEMAYEAYPKMSKVSEPHGVIPVDNKSHYIGDANEEKREGFIAGYRQAEKDILDNIWHNPDEEPEIDRKIIWESENFLGKHLDKEWKPKIDCFGRKERWCYLADILPSKNWTGERPYSKVDYSRGYDDGYEQAEKDLTDKAKVSSGWDGFFYGQGYMQAEKNLELTYDDICEIMEIREDVLEMDSYENLYEEILKRFNERKEK